MTYTTMEIGPDMRIPTHPGKSCGPCTKCCESVPVKEIGLLPYQRCPHLHGPEHAKIGCGIYQSRPHSCRLWSCLWLCSDLEDDVRPDRAGIVIDPIPDVCRVHGIEMPAAQVWVLPGFEEAYNKDPALAVILGLCAQGLAVLWRLPPGPDGVARGRVFTPAPPGGKIGRSEVITMAKELSGYATEGDRLRRAQQLVGGDND